MKRALAILAQFLLFLVVDAVGAIFYHPFGVQTKLSATGVAPRSFVWDGLILMLALYVVLLAVAAMRKRFAGAVPGSTLALVLAALIGYFLKFGFITHNW